MVNLTKDICFWPPKFCIDLILSRREKKKKKNYARSTVVAVYVNKRKTRIHFMVVSYSRCFNYL